MSLLVGEEDIKPRYEEEMGAWLTKVMDATGCTDGMYLVGNIGSVISS